MPAGAIGAEGKPSEQAAQSTVPTFNSCTKCVGSPGIINDRVPD